MEGLSGGGTRPYVQAFMRKLVLRKTQLLNIVARYSLLLLEACVAASAPPLPLQQYPAMHSIKVENRTRTPGVAVILVVSSITERPKAGQSTTQSL
ncbi:hypothetical protein FRC02_004880 [Tulasnella sp. 418]|nr:hypothetical protein FRC02_004880 [Tulasnella sp. 418]